MPTAMERAEIEAIFTSAALEAVRHYPLTVTSVELVSLAENVTFRVDTDEGASYVLRLHRPGYHTLPELRSERVWLRALADAGIAVPVPVASSDGQDYVSVTVAATGEQRLAGLTHWIDGEIVSQTLSQESDPAVVTRCFGQLGSIMAALHNQASGWAPPPAFVRHSLDIDGLMGEAPFWGRFWEHPELDVVQRDALLATREQIRRALQRYGREPGTFSMIHADLHHNNLLVNDEGLTIIDFDDAGFGWHQYDIAVALFHSAITPNHAEAEAAFFTGYRSLRPLSEADQALIPMFQLVRGMAVIGWKMQRPEVEWQPGFFEYLRSWVLDRCAEFAPPC